MFDGLSISEHKKTVIKSNKCKHSLEIGDCAIDNGLLLHFPGSTLAIFLYLVTHIDDNYIIETNPTSISSYLPDNCNPESINEDLNYLKKHGIIEIAEKRDGDYTYCIKLNISKLGKKLKKDKKISNSNNSQTFKNKQGLKCIYYDNREIRKKIISLPRPSRSELFQAILTFIPPEENISVLERTISQWLEDFDSDMIKELLRRVDKWLIKYNNPKDKAFHYLKGIIDDWYQKGISTYQELQHFDKLYRETRKLAELYGLPKWHNVKPIHMETFNRWLQEDYPLSTEVVKLAIQEAFRRKKDGQPSLQYIEENFIKPWKKNRVRDCQQARVLIKKDKNYPAKKKISFKSETNNAWDNFAWDFEK